MNKCINKILLTFLVCSFVALGANKKIPKKSIGLDLAADVYTEGDKVIASMNVAGIDPDKVDISINDDFLTVSGKREEEKETKGKNYYSKEISRGSFERTIKLPSLVDASKTKAEYKQGVLKITMPKMTLKSKAKIKIPVQKK